MAVSLPQPTNVGSNGQLGHAVTRAEFEAWFSDGADVELAWTNLRAALDQKHAEYEDLKQTMYNMTRNHALQLEAARMAGVHSVQEQTAVIVRAALELLEAVEGCEAFPPEKMAAFRRVFGA